MQHRITTARVRDFKRIRDILITPPADSSLLLIAGKNAQGKTSLLDALSVAFGGAALVPADPVRHGAESSEIVVELDGGALRISRKIAADGTSQLEVRDANGKVRKPQQMLDALIGARFLDPLVFLELSPAAQRGALLELLPNAAELAQLDAQRQAAFDKRTDVGRDLRRAEGELARMPVQLGNLAPIDTAESTAAIGEATAVLRQHDQAASKVADARRRFAAARDDRDRLRAELEAAEARMAAALADGNESHAAHLALPDKDAVQARIDELNLGLRTSGEHNRKVAADQAAILRRAEVAAEVSRQTDARDTLTGEIELVDKAKAGILAAAALPVPGLGVSDTGVMYQGIPLEQASGAERLRIALGLAIASANGLADVWMRDGALLDEDSLRVVQETCEAAGVRAWIERVGTSDEDAIVIVDGEVR
jgi:DNA repair exonuclease SbcCD ATPase subunit